MNPPAIKPLLPVLLILPFAALFGCGKKGEFSAKDDKELRSNFTRALTPEEIAHLNAAPAAGPKKK